MKILLSKFGYHYKKTPLIHSSKNFTFVSIECYANIVNIYFLRNGI